MKKINVVLTFCFIMFLSIFSNGQEKMRIIEKKPTKNDPIQVVSFEVADKVFENKNHVIANKTWLKDFKINLKNISNQTITYISVNLQIQPNGNLKIPLSLPLVFGNFDFQKSSANSNLSYKPLKPNQNVKISILPTALQGFVNEIMFQNGLEDIERVKIYFDFVVFEDGTAWSKGRLMRRNVNDPTRWEPISKKQSNFSISKNIYLNTIFAAFSNSDEVVKSSSFEESAKSSFFLRTIYLQNIL